MINWRSRLLSRFLRFFFYLLYHRFAWTYDFISKVVSVGMWQDWVLSIQPYLSGPSILELGHGPGHLQRALLTHQGRDRFTQSDVNIVGMDQSPQMGRLAIQRLKRANLRYSLVQAKSQSIPFPSESFEQITATFPSEFIYDVETIFEIARVLKKGGSIIILTQAQITGNQLTQRLASWLFRITKQTIDVDDFWRTIVLKPFIQAGFDARIEEIHEINSKIQFIIAKKSVI